jgi:hypothetical protein
VISPVLFRAVLCAVWAVWAVWCCVTGYLYLHRHYRG